MARVWKFLANFPVLKYRLILEAWKFEKVQRWFAGHPLFGRWYHPYLGESPENNEAIILPVQAVIRGGENTVLPYPLLEPLIQSAGGHFILGKCPCRNAEGRHTTLNDFGCLFLGEAVGRASPKMGRHTDIQGALSHVRQAIEYGLIPMIVHTTFDAEMLSLPYHKILGVCFCCDCCCTVRHHLRLGPSSFDDTVRRLPGLSVQITEACEGCDLCIEKCPVKAIQNHNNVAVIDAQRCKGCGVCAAVCPNGAPQLIMDEGLDVLAAIITRIRARTDVGI